MNMLKNTFSLGALATAAAICIPAGSANAQLTIVRNNLGGTPPATNTTGTGNLSTIFNAACDWWEAALITSPAHTLTLNFGWQAYSGPTLAAHSLVSQGGTPNRETEGNIFFDNDGSSLWFLDPTPCDNAEYGALVTGTGSYGAGAMNNNARYINGTGPASGRYDVFSTALHEIGHALGLSSSNVAFQAERVDNDVDVTAPRPYAGASLPLNPSTAHTAVSTTLMSPFATPSSRVLPSEFDILANAQISQWPGINFFKSCPRLTTTFSSNFQIVGAPGGAVYFSFEALPGSGGVTITDIDLNSSAIPGTPVSIDVYVQPNTGSCSYDIAGDWILRTTGTGFSTGPDNPTQFTLNSPLEFADGCCQGIAIVANGFRHWYSLGTTNPTIYSNSEVALTTGGASNIPFSAPMAEPRIVNTNIHYTLGGGLCGPPLTTTFASNNGGSADGAVYFSLEALAGSGGVTISDIDLNCNSATLGNAVSIDVYVQPNGGSCSYDPSGVWVLKTSGTGVNAGTDNPTNFVLSSPLELGEGCCLGVAIVANGFAHRYITGSSNPEVYSTQDLRLTAGAAGAPFSATFFEPRVVNARINYLLGGSCSDTGVAVSYGDGCVETFTSFYEVLTQAGMDLSGLEIWGSATASGHQVNTRPATIQPIGSLGTATALALGDDDQITAGTLGLSVGSNGWVARVTGNSNGFVPDVATMLANPSEGYYAWTDLQPNATGSGLVYYEEAGTQWMVTYDGVYLWNTTDPVTIQFRGNEANGNFVISFGALGSTGPEDWLIGHSGAGASADPGPRDLSQATIFGFLAADADRASLELATVNSPVLGGPFQMQTTNIPATAVFHVGVMGLSQVTVPLALAFPSANPGCSLHASVDLVVDPQLVLGGPGSLTWTGIDLTSVSLLGANVYFQAATLDLSGLSGTVRTSNGVEITTGLY